MHSTRCRGRPGRSGTPGRRGPGRPRASACRSGEGVRLASRSAPIAEAGSPRALRGRLEDSPPPRPALKRAGLGGAAGAGQADHPAPLVVLRRSSWRLSERSTSSRSCLPRVGSLTAVCIERVELVEDSPAPAVGRCPPVWLRDQRLGLRPVPREAQRDQEEEAAAEDEPALPLQAGLAQQVLEGAVRHRDMPPSGPVRPSRDGPLRAPRYSNPRHRAGALADRADCRRMPGPRGSASRTEVVTKRSQSPDQTKPIYS